MHITVLQVAMASDLRLPNYLYKPEPACIHLRGCAPYLPASVVCVSVHQTCVQCMCVCVSPYLVFYLSKWHAPRLQ